MFENALGAQRIVRHVEFAMGGLGLYLSATPGGPGVVQGDIRGFFVNNDTKVRGTVVRDS